MRRFLVLPFLLALHLILLTSHVCAYDYVKTTTGIPWRWPTRNIQYWINPEGSGLSPDQALAAIQSAFQSWEQTGVGLAFSFMGFTDSKNSLIDQKNIIFWSADRTIISGAYGQTILSGDPTTGKIQDADIVLNQRMGLLLTESPECGGSTIFNLFGIPLDWNLADQRFEFGLLPGSDKYLVQVQATVTHEIGHLLGLNHSTVSDASMSTIFVTPTIWCSTTQAALKADDIAGIQFLYPPAAPSWTRLTPATPKGFPVGAQTSQSTAYDAANDRLIVFGGSDPLVPCCVELQDTWVLVNATGSGGTPTWTQPTLTGLLPPGRHEHSAVYDPATNRMIMFGGGQFNGNVFSPLFQDVWVLKHANGLGATLADPAGWELLPTSGGPPAARSGHGAVYNPVLNEMVIFGGGNNGIMSVPGDLWVLTNANQDTGAQWIGPLPQAGNVPGPIEHFAAAYNPLLDALTIAGGCCGYTNATRLLSHATGSSSTTPTWMNLTPAGTLPPAGDQQQFGYDQASNRLIVHGPAPGGGTNATWLLKDAISTTPTKPMWVNSIPENAPGSPPEGLIVTGSAYNAAQKKFILTTVHTDPRNPVPEVWILNNADQPGPPSGLIFQDSVTTWTAGEGICCGNPVFGEYTLSPALTTYTLPAGFDLTGAFLLIGSNIDNSGNTRPVLGHLQAQIYDPSNNQLIASSTNTCFGQGSCVGAHLTFPPGIFVPPVFSLRFATVDGLQGGAHWSVSNISMWHSP